VVPGLLLGAWAFGSLLPSWCYHTPFSYRLVDPHSHLGDASSPALDGASGDLNSYKGTVQPWLRSLDGLNTHDDSYSLSIAGGVTSAIVLPGSANAIGDLVFSVVV
jgi:imidazolonepropionase-like amidohydrolase